MDKKNYEIPTEMRDFAEKSVEQARKAFEGFVGAAQRSVATSEAAAAKAQTQVKEYGHKAFAFAETNVNAAFDLAQRLVRAKDVQEVMQLQSEFMKSQMQSMQTQAQEFGSAMQAQAKELTAMAQSQAKEFGDAVQKTASQAAQATQAAAKPAKK
jgi:phasin